MTDIGAVSEAISGTLLLWSAITVILLGYAAIKCFQLAASKYFTVVSCAAGTASLVMNQVMLAAKKDMTEFPCIAVLLINVFFTATAVLLLIKLLRYRKDGISGVSVKEAIDSLPTGICCALPNGTPILINDRMNAICTELTGMPIGDANDFSEMLVSGSLSGVIESGEKPVVRTAGGKVYSFTLNSFDMDGAACRELLAADTTDIYARIEELREKKRRAEMLNKRLKALTGTIEYITMSRELMTMKAALHDDLGRCLMLVKRYLCDPDSVDINDITELWSLSIRKLENESPEFWQTPYYVLEKQADLLGIELTVIGEMPPEPKYAELINSAVSTHLLNVFEHAHGTKAQIVFGEDNGFHTIRMTNDGDPPEPDMTERGGLKTLKELAVMLGGSTRLTAVPAFVYEIILPKGE